MLLYCALPLDIFEPIIPNTKLTALLNTVAAAKFEIIEGLSMW